jgi:hypothetical protein
MTGNIRVDVPRDRGVLAADVGALQRLGVLDLPEGLRRDVHGGGTNFRLTEESIRLWEKRTREYVEEVGP